MKNIEDRQKFIEKISTPRIKEWLEKLRLKSLTRFLGWANCNEQFRIMSVTQTSLYAPFYLDIKIDRYSKIKEIFLLGSNGTDKIYLQAPQNEVREFRIGPIDIGERLSTSKFSLNFIDLLGNIITAFNTLSITPSPTNIINFNETIINENTNFNLQIQISKQGYFKYIRFINNDTNNLILEMPLDQSYVFTVFNLTNLNFSEAKIKVVLIDYYDRQIIAPNLLIIQSPISTISNVSPNLLSYNTQNNLTIDFNNKITVQSVNLKIFYPSASTISNIPFTVTEFNSKPRIICNILANTLSQDCKFNVEIIDIYNRIITNNLFNIKTDYIKSEISNSLQNFTYLNWDTNFTISFSVPLRVVSCNLIRVSDNLYTPPYYFDSNIINRVSSIVIKLPKEIDDFFKVGYYKLYVRDEFNRDIFSSNDLILYSVLPSVFSPSSYKTQDYLQGLNIDFNDNLTTLSTVTELQFKLISQLQSNALDINLTYQSIVGNNKRYVLSTIFSGTGTSIIPDEYVANYKLRISYKIGNFLISNDMETVLNIIPYDEATINNNSILNILKSTQNQSITITFNKSTKLTSAKLIGSIIKSPYSVEMIINPTNVFSNTFSYSLNSLLLYPGGYYVETTDNFSRKESNALFLNYYLEILSLSKTQFEMGKLPSVDISFRDPITWISTFTAGFLENQGGQRHDFSFFSIFNEQLSLGSLTSLNIEGPYRLVIPYTINGSSFNIQTNYNLTHIYTDPQILLNGTSMMTLSKSTSSTGVWTTQVVTPDIFTDNSGEFYTIEFDPKKSYEYLVGFTNSNNTYPLQATSGFGGTYLDNVLSSFLFYSGYEANVVANYFRFAGKFNSLPSSAPDTYENIDYSGIGGGTMIPSNRRSGYITVGVTNIQNQGTRIYIGSSRYIDELKSMYISSLEKPTNIVLGYYSKSTDIAPIIKVLKPISSRPVHSFNSQYTFLSGGTQKEMYENTTSVGTYAYQSFMLMNNGVQMTTLPQIITIKTSRYRNLVLFFLRNTTELAVRNSAVGTTGDIGTDTAQNYYDGYTYLQEFKFNVRDPRGILSPYTYDPTSFSSNLTQLTLEATLSDYFTFGVEILTSNSWKFIIGNTNRLSECRVYIINNNKWPNHIAGGLNTRLGDNTLSYWSIVPTLI